MLPRRHPPLRSIGQALLLALVFSGASDVSGQYRSEEYPTFDSWKAACEKLPSNRALLGQAPPAKLPTTLPKFDPVAEALMAAFDLFKTGTMNKAENWVGGNRRTEFFNRNVPILCDHRSVPAVRTKAFRTKRQRGDFHGDFHGDIHSSWRCSTRSTV